MCNFARCGHAGGTASTPQYTSPGSGAPVCSALPASGGDQGARRPTAVSPSVFPAAASPPAGSVTPRWWQACKLDQSRRYSLAHCWAVAWRLPRRCSGRMHTPPSPAWPPRRRRSSLAVFVSRRKQLEAMTAAVGRH